MNAQEIPLFLIDQPVNLLNLPDKQWTPIATDWSASPLPFTWKFFLAKDNKLLHFFTRSTVLPDLHPDSEPGGFTPELWKYTVAEVFFFSAGGTAYHEFNVAPNSAWWYSKFSEYRVPEKNVRPEALQLTPLAYRTPAAWIAGISFSLSVLPEDMLVSVCGIAGHEAQTFICAAADSTIEPDFHLKRLARPVRIVAG